MKLQVYGIPVEVGHSPVLDPDFIPMHLYNEAFLKTAKKPIGIAVERAGNEMASCHTFIHGTPEYQEADRYYIRRLVKTLLWMKGGYKVYCDNKEIFPLLHQDFRTALRGAFC